MEQKTERQGRAYAGNCDPEPQGLARDPAQAVRYQKGKLKDPLSVPGVPSERGSCCWCFFFAPAKSGSIGQYLTAAKNEKPAKLRDFNVTSRVLYSAREGTRTRRRHLCRKQSHSAALLSLRVPINRNVYQGCTHFVPVSFCAREQTSNNTIYYIKESAMNSENSSRFFSYAGSGGRTTKND